MSSIPAHTADQSVDKYFRGRYRGSLTTATTLCALGAAMIDRLASALRVEEGWREIATAPTDGTHVILAFGQDHVSEGWWEDADPGPHPWKFIDQVCPGSPFTNGELLNGAREVRGGPTHWRPLPAPPSVPASEEAGDG